MVNVFFENDPQPVLKITNEKKDILLAQKILYEVYCVEQKWIPQDGNPSNSQIIENEKNQKLLVDDWDNEMIWAIVFIKNTAVACARMSFGNEEGKFEIENYLNKNSPLQFKEYLKLVELGRLAILPSFRNAKISFILLHAAFNFCTQNQLSVFSATSIDKVKCIFHSIAFKPIDKFKFKYDENDQDYCMLYWADFKKGEVKIIFEQIQEKMQQFNIKYSIETNLVKDKKTLEEKITFRTKCKL